MKQLVEIRVLADPPGQPEEDRIVGRMCRLIFAFEGEVYNKELHRRMLAIVNMSMRDAEIAGANPRRIYDVARRISIRLWNRELPL